MIIRWNVCAALTFLERHKEENIITKSLQDSVKFYGRGTLEAE